MDTAEGWKIDLPDEHLKKPISSCGICGTVPTPTSVGDDKLKTKDIVFKKHRPACVDELLNLSLP